MSRWRTVLIGVAIICLGLVLRANADRSVGALAARVRNCGGASPCYASAKVAGLLTPTPTATPTRTRTPTPTPTPTHIIYCTAPPCPNGRLVCGNPKGCPGGCGTICQEYTRTPTITPMPTCTRPACPNGQLVCVTPRGCPSGCGYICQEYTHTPTATPTPPGDLGWRTIGGAVRDDDSFIAGATVTCHQLSYSPRTVCAGSRTTGADGAYSFGSVFIHDTDSIRVNVQATGYQSQTIQRGGVQAFASPTFDFVLLPSGAPDQSLRYYLPVILRNWPPVTPIPLPRMVLGNDACPGLLLNSTWDNVVQDWAEEDRVDQFVFDAQAGVHYTIETGNLGPRADTVLELYAPNCSTLLVQNDDIHYPDSLASRINWMTTIPGRYHLKVRSYDWTIRGPGAKYTLQIKAEP